MQLFEVGEPVFLMRFLPDGRRLVLATHGSSPGQAVTFHVLSLATGERIPLDVPLAKLGTWDSYAWCGNAIAVHPAGDVVYIAWGPGCSHSGRATANGSRCPKASRRTRW